MKGLKILFATVVTIAFVLGFLTFPDIDLFLDPCSKTILCGRNIRNLLNYFGKTDSAALAFGNYLYEKVISGTIVFIITLAFTMIAHKIYIKFRGFKKED